jgi:hypothetical protein
MNLDLTDGETAALIRELDRIIEDNRDRLSPRIMTLKAIRASVRKIHWEELYSHSSQ